MLTARYWASWRSAGRVTNGATARSVIASSGTRLFAGVTAGGSHGAGTAFELLDKDIEERFVKGSGPGGQKINKVRNCVQLTHVPSGVSVSCQDARELHANRHIARKRLKEKVEFHLQGDDSKVGRRINKIRDRKARSQRKARLKHQGAAAASARGGEKIAEVMAGDGGRDAGNGSVHGGKEKSEEKEDGSTRVRR